jgi:hypothetical protein
MAPKYRIRNPFLFGGTCMLIAFALAAPGAPAVAASLSPFAHDAAGRSVLEFYPETVAKFSAQGRDLVRLKVKETPAENDPIGPVDLELVVDCQSRQLAPAQATTTAKDGRPAVTVGAFKMGDLKPPPEGMYQRFVIGLCDGELLGVQALPAKSGWKHFVEGASRALYFSSGSAKTIGKFRAASVRLYELGGAQLPDGRRIDARDAVWVIDCERKLGAVAYERSFARVADQNQTVVSIGDEKAFADPAIAEPDKLRFGQPVAGSMQARFGDALCAGNPDLQ